MSKLPASRPARLLLSFTRVWLPGAIALAGVVLIVLGHGSYSQIANTHSVESAGGVALLIVALIVWMLNWMYRLSVASSADRDREERAREYFDRTGRWPDEEPPGTLHRAAADDGDDGDDGDARLAHGYLDSAGRWHDREHP